MLDNVKIFFFLVSHNQHLLCTAYRKTTAHAMRQFYFMGINSIIYLDTPSLDESKKSYIIVIVTNIDYKLTIHRRCLNGNLQMYCLRCNL